MKQPYRFVAAFIIVAIVSLIGAFSTNPGVNDWYQSLVLPSFNPPSFIFGIVWPILYLMIALSLFYFWRKGIDNVYKKNTFFLFLFHLILNASWSLVFFNLESAILGLVVILCMLATLAIVMTRLWKISHVSVYLLVPYTLWLVFASVLNLAIVLLN